VPRRPGDPPLLPANSADQIADVLYAAGFRGEGLAMGVSIVLRESGGSPNARNWNTNGTVDRGWWQWNSGAWPDISAEMADDPARATAKAYQVSKGGTSFGPWYSSAGVTKFYAAGKTAAEAVVARGGSASSPASAETNLSTINLGSGTGPIAGPPDPSVPGGGLVPAIVATTSPDVGLPPAGTMLSSVYVEPLSVKGISLGRLGLHEAQRVTGGEMSMSVSEVSQLSVTMVDPDHVLGRRDTLVTGAPLAWQRVSKEPTKAQPLAWTGQIAAHEIDGDDPLTWKITGRSLGSQLLRHPTARIVAAASAKGQSLTEYAHGLANVAGLDFTGQGLPRLGDIAPTTDKSGGDKGTPETPWEVLQRLADDEGVWCWEASGHLYVGRPSWLVNHLVTVLVSVPEREGREQLTDCIGLPRPRDSIDAPEKGVTLDLRLPRWRGELVRPGMTVRIAWPKWLANYPDTYLVTSVSWPLDGGLEPVSIACVEPIDPEAKTKTTTTGADVAPGPTVPGAVGSPTGPPIGANLGTAGDPRFGSDLVSKAIAFALAQIGKPYVWGAVGPEAYDCTGLINAAYAAAGKNIDSRSNPTRGAHVVPRSELRAGDIVSFPGFTHSALALSSTEMVEAPQTGIPVRRMPMRAVIALVERVN